MNLILPVAGESSRFPDMKPKFLLTHPNGNLMIMEAIKGLNLNKVERIVIIGLEEHEEKYEFSEDLKKEFSSHRVDIHLLKNKTKNQPETVYEGIKRSKLKGSILIKDCDNYFELKDYHNNNFIAVADLQKQDKINASNKSYVNIGSKNTVVNIIEKEIISNVFCCGVYHFENVNEYLSYYKELADYEHLFLSHIIYKMILDKKVFFTKEVKNYIDWGTIEDWNNYKDDFSTVFIDIDGVLLENSGKYCKPKWGDVGGIVENIDIINKLYETNKVHIVITTARPEDIAIKHLEENNVKYHNIIANLPHAKRILINDYANSNPYPSAIAVNLERNSNRLEELL